MNGTTVFEKGSRAIEYSSSSMLYFVDSSTNKIIKVLRTSSNVSKHTIKLCQYETRTLVEWWREEKDDKILLVKTMRNFMMSE